MVTENISWISKQISFWMQTIVIKTLTTGHIPKHVAVILDGNRRHASRAGITKSQGYLKGYVLFGFLVLN